MRIAIASTDGTRVDQHFGHAQRFYVYELVAGVATPAAIRPNEPSCGRQDGAAAHTRALDLISDCDIVVVANVGPCALGLIEARGMTCFETTDVVTRVLTALAELEMPRVAEAQQ